MPLIVGVPRTDYEELVNLAAELGQELDTTEQNYFDGADFVDLLVPIIFSGAAWATLRTWIVTRAAQHKLTRITYNGVEIESMSPKDAERIIKAIDEAQHSDGAS